MTSKIISFGFKHGEPKDALTMDVRALFGNPHFHPDLRHRNGLDPAVGKFIEQGYGFDMHYASLKHQAETLKVDTLYIGCTGGKHRSVYLADRLGRELGVPVEHRDIAK